MKCKHCNGTGATNWYVNRAFVTCPYCCGTGEMEVEQTEEEWVKSLNTKQFAKWLDNLLMRCLCRDCNFCPIHKEPNCTCEGIEEWLKQPHKEDKHNEII